MTPPAAAAAAPRTRTRRHEPAPRRVSGPSRKPTPQQGPPRLVVRLGGAVHSIAEHRWLERLIRGRAWIGIVGVGLIGIVFMQVSMLRMNAGIGASVERAGVLERENAAMRATISELSSSDRIAAEASKLGLVMPSSTPRYLDGRTASARRALQSMTAPGVGIVPVETTEEAVPATSTTPTLAATSIAPTTTEPMAADGTAVTPTPTTQEPVQPQTSPTTTSAPRATTDPAAGTTPPATGTETQQPAATPASATTGGATADGQIG
jgi:hypothetical protein